MATTVAIEYNRIAGADKRGRFRTKKLEVYTVGIQGEVKRGRLRQGGEDTNAAKRRKVEGERRDERRGG